MEGASHHHYLIHGSWTHQVCLRLSYHPVSVIMAESRNTRDIIRRLLKGSVPPEAVSVSTSGSLAPAPAPDSLSPTVSHPAVNPTYAC